MNQLPVIYLAFANDLNNPLVQLKEEAESIYRILTAGASNQYYQLHREVFSSVESISHYLMAYKNRIQLLHYGGHASSEKLFLEEEAYSSGIAKLLQQQENLKVVFLNGCSTYGQVQALQQYVPAVIATSTPVNDSRAKEFAIQFYKALVKEYTLKDAFELAAAYLETKVGDSVGIHRGIDKAKQKTNDDALEWGLYITVDEVLQWQIPKVTHKTIVIGGVAGMKPKKQPVNQQLTQGLFGNEKLSEYKDELKREFEEAKKGDYDIRVARRVIMDCMPAPIGEDIRKLFFTKHGEPQAD